ncbi:Clavaminate synthase-like protein [Lojkania enalia]|uniref:Clavaminate synthase-like protein n=1 Tax=Lojkania enalia TaxID=147567 RepID=A0A9P4N8B1_9PLEO|nr:Clavaminate synthase-like protein [Didymosphaeria enalia]
MPHSETSSPSPSPSSFPDLPPFPDTVPTAPLLSISYQKLLSRDREEEDRCWKACRELGFFYLDLRRSPHSSSSASVDQRVGHAGQLFDVMQRLYEEFDGMSEEGRQRFDFKDRGSYFGYKGMGKGFVDKFGTRDRNEFYNISKDDILGLTPQLDAPELLTQHRGLCEAYIRRAHAVCKTVIQVLDQRLALSESARRGGGLAGVHRLDAVSGDQIRFVRAPPQERAVRGVALGEHTDFGSVTVLFNRAGGLQVRLPECISAIPAKDHGASTVEQELCKDGWTYVRPLPGHCIVNLGDALVKFSNGELRSNIHRVVAPPGEQAKVTRYSLVYFCRPEDDVRLRSLVECGETEGECVTAKEWILRRALGRRKVDGWEGSGGTEKESMRAGK